MTTLETEFNIANKLLIKGNSKLGKDIYNFSIPPLITCVGRSSICSQRCYVMGCRGDGYLRRYPNVLATYMKNWFASQDSDFVDKMVEEIKSKCPKYIRIHVSGDFYNNKYIEKWHEIVKACPDTRFKASTRSWRVENIKKALDKFAEENNMVLEYSADKATGLPKEHEKTVYLSTSRKDIPDKKVKVILKDKPLRDSIWPKKINGSLVCPQENGDHDLTCSECLHCY